MDVKEYEGRLGDELKHVPQLADQRTKLRQKLSAAYVELCGENPWPFLIRKAPLWIMPDLTLANADVTRLGDRAFIVERSVLQAAGMWPALDAGILEHFARFYVGAEFGLADTDRRDRGTGWEAGPYTVEYIIPGDPVTFILEPRCVVPAFGGTLNEGSVVVRQKRVMLPADLANLRAIREKDGRRVLVPKTASEFARLSDQTGSTPTCYGEDGGQETRLPPLLYPDAGLVDVGRNLDGQYHRSNEPVRTDPPFVATSAGGGRLPVGTLRFFVSWWYAGRFSPRSRVVEVNTTNANKTVELTAMPRQEGASLWDSGRRLSVWVAKPEGPFWLAGWIANPTAAAPTFTLSDFPAHVTNEENTDRPWRTNRWDQAYPGGLYHYVRPWPRPSVPTEYELEYKFRPKALIEDVDEPEFEQAFHEVLVWRTLARMSAIHNAGTFYGMVKDQLRTANAALARRYGQQDRYRITKASVDGAGESSYPLPEIDYQYDGP